VLNGVLLAFFALVQFFSSPHDTVYWTYKTRGAVFGPFVCRTHFPAYMNLCISAGIGLLLGLDPEAAEGKRRRRRRRRRRARGAFEVPPEGATPKAAEETAEQVAVLFEDSRKLWIGCGLALMIASVGLSLARGGVIALLAGTLVFLTLRPSRWVRQRWVAP